MLLVASNDDISENMSSVSVASFHELVNDWRKYKVDGVDTTTVYTTDIEDGTMLCEVDSKGEKSQTRCLFSTQTKMCGFEFTGDIATSKTGSDLIEQQPQKPTCQGMDSSWKFVTPVDFRLSGGIAAKYECVGKPTQCWKSDKFTSSESCIYLDETVGEVHTVVRRDTVDTEYKTFYDDPGMTISDTNSASPPARLFNTNTGSNSLLIDSPQREN